MPFPVSITHAHTLTPKPARGAGAGIRSVAADEKEAAYDAGSRPCTRFVDAYDALVSSSASCLPL